MNKLFIKEIILSAVGMGAIIWVATIDWRIALGVFLYSGINNRALTKQIKEGW